MYRQPLFWPHTAQTAAIDLANLRRARPQPNSLGALKRPDADAAIDAAVQEFGIAEPHAAASYPRSASKFPKMHSRPL